MRIPWSTVIKIGTGFMVAFAIAVACGAWLREPLQAFGTLAVQSGGLPGLFGAILVIDSVPTPLSYVPFMLLALWGMATLILIFCVVLLVNEMRERGQEPWGDVWQEAEEFTLPPEPTGPAAAAGRESTSIPSRVIRKARRIEISSSRIRRGELQLRVAPAV